MLKDRVVVPEPGAAMVVGAKIFVAPALGNPAIVKPTAELNPFAAAVVKVMDPVLPASMLSVVVDGVNVKVGAFATVNVMTCV